MTNEYIKYFLEIIKKRNYEIEGLNIKTDEYKVKTYICSITNNKISIIFNIILNNEKYLKNIIKNIGFIYNEDIINLIIKKLIIEEKIKIFIILNISENYLDNEEGLYFNCYYIKCKNYNIEKGVKYYIERYNETIKLNKKNICILKLEKNILYLLSNIIKIIYDIIKNQ